VLVSRLIVEGKNPTANRDSPPIGQAGAFLTLRFGTYFGTLDNKMSPLGAQVWDATTVVAE
jgi:hypothetical protein